MILVTRGELGEARLAATEPSSLGQGSDQYLVASRVETLKADVALDKRKITPQTLRQAVDAVVSDKGIRANIETIQDSFRKDGGFVRAADEIRLVSPTAMRSRISISHSLRSPTRG